MEGWRQVIRSGTRAEVSLAENNTVKRMKRALLLEMRVMSPGRQSGLWRM